MKLNGWHRLWILLSVVYFVLVTSYVILRFPKAETIRHQSEFYKKLSKKSAGMIFPSTDEDALALGVVEVSDPTDISAINTVAKPKPRVDYKQEYGSWENYQKTMKEEWDNAKPYELHPLIEMPNKHTIEFKENLSEEDMRIASQEYWRVVEKNATGERLYFMLYAFLFWLVPCMGLYALGWSINWVYKGFKHKKDAQQLNQGDGE